jgi:endonuclease III
MPEDSNPGLPVSEIDNYHYFTLPMALNYQRNSYTLWRAARTTYFDPTTSDVFRPKAVCKMDESDLAAMLMKHSVALQPRKHTATWRRLCETIQELYEGDIRTLFTQTSGSVPAILEIIQGTQKKQFPYLSGPKIANYWLHVMESYTDVHLTDRGGLTVAPDTHVIQASVRLGLVQGGQRDDTELRNEVAEAWRNVLAPTGILPIDVHTPLWLWSRSGFQFSAEIL